MGADTIMMTWKALMKKIQAANAMDTLEIWAELKEYEAYMANKGYVIHIDRVLSPSGETLWER